MRARVNASIIATDDSGDRSQHDYSGALGDIEQSVKQEQKDPSRKKKGKDGSLARRK